MINTFEFLINTAVENLEMIGDAKDKAIICAELAKAIAMSGALRPETTEVIPVPVQEEKEIKEEPKKASKKKSNKKDALKTENTKTPAPVEEAAPEIPEEPVVTPPEIPEEPAQVPEVEMVDEWTEEMQELKTEQLQLLNTYVEAWGEEFVYGDCLSAFSEGALVGGENVRPSNIDGFIVYLNELAQQNAE